MEEEALGPIIVDSCMWIELLLGSYAGKTLEKYISKDCELMVSAISIAEVYLHIIGRKGREPAKRFMQFMEGRCFVMPVLTDIAMKAAELKEESKLGLVDAIIYATALLRDATLLTCDSDFKDKEKVKYMSK